MVYSDVDSDPDLLILVATQGAPEEKLGTWAIAVSVRGAQSGCVSPPDAGAQWQHELLQGRGGDGSGHEHVLVDGLLHVGDDTGLGVMDAELEEEHLTGLDHLLLEVGAQGGSLPTEGLGWVRRSQ